MSVRLWLQAVGLGLSLASVVLLWMGQAFRPEAVARQGAAVFSFNPPAIVERASAGLTQRAATGLLALSLSLQLAVLATIEATPELPPGLILAAVVVGTAAITLLVWRLVKGMVMSQRLVRVAATPPTDEVTPLEFLYALDCERRGHPSGRDDAPGDLRAFLARRYRFARGFADLCD